MDRKYYLDLLRVISTAAVLLVHIISPVMFKMNSLSLSTWLWADIAYSSARFGVPVFLMISGSLLLNKEINLFKQIARVAVPLVFASSIYILWFNFTRIDYDPLYDFFKILKEPVVYHLWFCYIIIALYLLQPLLKKIAEDDEATKYLLILWLLFTVVMETVFKIFPITKMVINLHIYSGFIGLMFLGYFIDKKQIEVKSSILIFLYLIGLSFNVYANYYFTTLNNQVLDEHFNQEASPGVILMSISVFLLLKKYANREIPKKLIVLSETSFFVYLIHVLFIEILKYFGLDVLMFDNFLPGVLIVYILVLVCSYCVSVFFSKFRLIRFFFNGK